MVREKRKYEKKCYGMVGGAIPPPEENDKNIRQLSQLKVLVIPNKSGLQGSRQKLVHSVYFVLNII